MDEELKKQLKKLEKRVEAIEEYLEELPAFVRADVDISDEVVDELYDQAVWIAIGHEKASAAMLQRHLQIGFNRAARILEQLEVNGIVGPSNGSEPREVLIKEEDLQALRQKLEEKQEKLKKKKSHN